ncbi:hypothetical protein [Achromobacter xylosoxidans]|uniref:hypothetical protein n=1 Tax=Alcaligenes xylosoxydans xylosoxydans TaxID=85698 RepID=UPI001231918E|nr:hypothetical protein [Achromobacter xylosoxidans]
MARTFSMAYKDTPQDFQKRVEATLEAQSLAISAALAFIARYAKHDEALTHIRMQLDGLAQANKQLYPMDERDKFYAMEHIGTIFRDAEQMKDVEFPWDSGSDKSK